MCRRQKRTGSAGGHHGAIPRMPIRSCSKSMVLQKQVARVEATKALLCRLRRKKQDQVGGSQWIDEILQKTFRYLRKGTTTLRTQ